MPFAVYVLGLGIFAQGTSEFMLSGLLPSLADDFGVSVPDAGLLISAFAIGMIVGAPLLAVATLRWPRRTALVAFQAVFVAGHVVGALAPGTACCSRPASSPPSPTPGSGPWPPPRRRPRPRERAGKAMAVVSSGLSLATVVGVPAGTVLGQHAGWRAAFWAVAALTVLSLVAVAVSLPRGDRDTGKAPRSVRGELRALARPGSGSPTPPRRSASAPSWPPSATSPRCSTRSAASPRAGSRRSCRCSASAPSSG
ncbi:MFS transporter [Streptomyces sp. M19]